MSSYVRTTIFKWAVAVLLTLLVAMFLYVGAYLALGKRFSLSYAGSTRTQIVFPSPQTARPFVRLAAIEANVSGRTILVCWKPGMCVDTWVCSPGKRPTYCDLQ